MTKKACSTKKDGLSSRLGFLFCGYALGRGVAGRAASRIAREVVIVLILFCHFYPKRINFQKHPRSNRRFNAFYFLRQSRVEQSR